VLPYIVAGIAGMLFAQRGRPAVSHSKTTALGPRSGVKYQIDDFSTAGLVLVKAPDNVTVVSLRRNRPPKTGFIVVNAVGNPKVIDVITKDFLP
jgi:hypothetical protein